MLAGLSRNLEARPYAVQMIGWVTVYVILWFVLAVSACFVVVSRYSQMRERTQELAILKMLGASTEYICDMLCEETAWVVVPGTVLGILWAYAGRSLIGIALPHSFVLRAAYDWWPLACLIAALGYLLAGLVVWGSVGKDVVQALGYEE